MRKLREYCLNTSHSDGKHKARVFLSSLGISADDAEWLAAALLDGVASASAFVVESSPWGVVYRVDVEVRRGHRCAKVRTGWMCSGSLTKLTTCFVIGVCDENS